MTIKSNVMQSVVMGSIAEGSKPAVVAKSDELVLNSKQLALIGESVDGAIRADDLLFQGDELKGIVAKAVAKVLKPEPKAEPSFAWWNFVATSWQNVYMTRNKLSNEKSAENAWYDVCKRMKKDFELVKPKAPSADASRMSEKRKAEMAELQAKPDSVLREEYLAYKAEDNLTKATAIQREMNRREKQNNSASLDKRKARQALLASAMRKIADDDLLQIIWDLVPESVKLEVAKSAK